jgi:hypothetical protein
MWMGECGLFLLNPIDSIAMEVDSKLRDRTWKVWHSPLGSHWPSLLIRGGNILVENQPSIFRVLNNDVVVIQLKIMGGWALLVALYPEIRRRHLAPLSQHWVPAPPFPQ